jgi:hypothetical protein
MRVTLERETDVQRDVRACYERLGCAVYSTSNPRRTKNTPGLPDLWVMVPIHRGWYWWHETKARDGRQSEAQKLFETRCQQAGMDYVLGGLAAALDHLRAIGLVK